MTSNTAAWITAAKAKPFEIKPYPLSTPGANQILIKNHALAVNPIDGKLQALAILPLKYPTILGEDVAGKVIAVGSDVTLFKTGDRVIGNAAGFGTKRDEDKGFQAYTILETNMACRIPDTISFEQAVVLPLAVSTASSGLFNPDFLNLQLPTEPAQSPTDKSLLVWGGASSVGSCAIQLAVAAGYEVVTTASPKNFEYVKKLGAQYVFDYNSTSVVSDIVTTLKGKVIAGAFDAVGGAAWAPTVAVVEQSEGVKFVATVTPGFPDPPNALQAGSFIPAPEPLVAGRGLSSIQTAVNLQREGTSAQKVVVVLDT